VDAH
jgi:hypothetical protein